MIFMEHKDTKTQSMKKRNLRVALLTALVTLMLGVTFAACSNDDDDNKDMTPPTITDRGITANPVNCQVYHPGDTIFFRYLFEDNQELGSYNIEVHGNFDHHSHSTEADDHDHEGGECSHDAHHHDEDEDDDDDDEGTTPWIFNQAYQIPAGLQSFSAATDIVIPANATHGDYHFMIRLTDQAGWQQLKAVAIIIEE